ncbi:MAG: DUF1844 domain-containing protein [Nitrospirota bacterium]
MSGEDEKGFVIRDRRGRGSSEESAPAGQPGTASEAGSTDASARTAGQSSGSSVPVTFSSFVISLGTSAFMLMGEQADPQQQTVPVNLPQAKEIIDLLSVLEVKTKGNLTSEEQGVLSEMLYALRMKYVDLAAGKHAIHTP